MKRETIQIDLKAGLSIIKSIDVKQGDIVLISAMSEGFYVTKFTEKDIISFL